MQATLRSPLEFGFGELNQGMMNPGTLGEAYIELRRNGFADDGMVLACAQFDGLYKDIVDRAPPSGMNMAEYWQENFRTIDLESGQEPAEPGVGIREYGAVMLKTLVRQPHGDMGPDIGMPLPYSVPGGRFGIHGYYHDTYHVSKASMADGEHQAIVDSVDGMEYQINRFGSVKNGSAFFYTDRSQIPYFSHSVRMLSEVFGDEALIRYLPAMQKEYDYWMNKQSTVKLPDGSVLNRYWSTGDGPRLESYLEDVEVAELAFQTLGRNPQQVYKNLRIGAASAWDFSSRWLANGMDLATINTSEILPVDLNSMLAYTEEALSTAYFASGDRELADEYFGRYQARIKAINKFEYDPVNKVYRDYNFNTGRQTSVDSAAMVTPLYVGIADKEQVLGVADFVRRHLLKEGGVITTTVETGQQWDAPNVWAPPNWQAARGTARAANEIIGLTAKESEVLLTLSEDVRSAYLHGMQVVFDRTGFIPEKVNGIHPGWRPVDGEYQNVKVLGMSVAVRHALETWDPRKESPCLPLGKRLSRPSII